MNPALESIAKLADDVFTLIPPDAPGAHFCGAMFTVGGQRFPAGAADVDPESAKVRCLGEIAETVAQFVAPASLKVSPDGQGLDTTERSALEQVSGSFDGPWLAATRLSDGSAASVPATICLRSMESSGVSSLGCAAGETVQSATRSALFELIERDAVALWWLGGVQPIEIPESSLTGTRQSLAEVRQKLDSRQTTFLALQSIADIPVVCAISFDGEGKNLALGFGAAESSDLAASKALMEMLQMEVGNRIVSMKVAKLGLDSLTVPDQAIRDRMTLLDVSMPPFQTSGIAQFAPGLSQADIAPRLGGLGVQVFAVSLCREDADIKVMKLIAPALQPLPGLFETERLACAKKTQSVPLRHFPKVAIL